MPEITLLGWIHTIIAIIALITGFYSLAVFKVIRETETVGLIYLGCTLVAAATALMIYKHGGFGPAHGLAVLTLLALAGGYLVKKIPLFDRVADYLQAFCYSATLLFHMIPAITDGLLRLPVGDPFLTDRHDPLLQKFYLAFVAIFVVGVTVQMWWLHKHKAPQV